ncbi:MAG: hypothetical protein D6805_09120 [Planctomycetota bacterium]|nr:MAG: hypothetical protein D6805_09120 [Planctomycetota bacterium]
MNREKLVALFCLFFLCIGIFGLLRKLRGRVALSFVDIEAQMQPVELGQWQVAQSLGIAPLLPSGWRLQTPKNPWQNVGIWKTPRLESVELPPLELEEGYIFPLPEAGVDVFLKELPLRKSLPQPQDEPLEEEGQGHEAQKSSGDSTSKTSPK